MLRKWKPTAAVVCVVAWSWLTGTPAAADLLFSAGDPTTTSAFYDVNLQYPDPYQAYNQITSVYDNFDVPVGQTWNVSDIFAYIGTVPGDTNSTAYYEIRTGMNNGTGGSIFASGTLAVTTSASPNSVMINGEPTSKIQVDLATPIVLTGGTTYWVSLAPVGLYPDTTNRFIGSGGPTGAVNTPSTIQTYLYYSPYNSFTPDSYAYTLGLDGTAAAAAPEPSTLCLAGWGLLCAGVVWVRSRSRARRHAPN